MVFFFVCLLAIWVGRRTGWALRRAVLYKSNWTVCVLLSCAWAIGTAYCLRFLLLETHPGLLLKIFGYGAWAYVSIPNYGLIQDSTVAPKEMPRHLFLKVVPLFAFVAISITLAFSTLLPGRY